MHPPQFHQRNLCQVGIGEAVLSERAGLITASVKISQASVAGLRRMGPFHLNPVIPAMQVSMARANQDAGKAISIIAALSVIMQASPDDAQTMLAMLKKQKRISDIPGNVHIRLLAHARPM